MGKVKLTLNISRLPKIIHKTFSAKISAIIKYFRPVLAPKNRRPPLLRRRIRSRNVTDFPGIQLFHPNSKSELLKNCDLKAELSFPFSLVSPFSDFHFAIQLVNCQHQE